MIEPTRRGFFKGLLGTGLVLAAPAIIRIPNLLMPIKSAMPDLPLFGRTAQEGTFWVENGGQMSYLSGAELDRWVASLGKLSGRVEKLLSGGQSFLDRRVQEIGFQTNQSFG